MDRLLWKQISAHFFGLSLNGGAELLAISCLHNEDVHLALSAVGAAGSNAIII